jgi:hypothetical protein
MKQTLLILFAAVCFSSCTVENYCNHDNDRSNRRDSTSEAAFLQRMREMPTRTNIVMPTRTNIVTYNTSTPVVHTYHYSAPAVTYRKYYNNTNCAPIFRMRAGSNRYEVVGRSHSPVGNHHQH